MSVFLMVPPGAGCGEEGGDCCYRDAELPGFARFAGPGCRVGSNEKVACLSRHAVRWNETSVLGKLLELGA